MSDPAPVTEKTPDIQQRPSGVFVLQSVAGSVVGIVAYSLALLPGGIDVVFAGAPRAGIVAVPIGVLVGLVSRRLGATRNHVFAVTTVVCLLLCFAMSCNMTR